KAPVNAPAAAERGVTWRFGFSDFLLRISLFASVLTATVLLAAANQTIVLQLPFPPFEISRTAKYLLTALSVTGLYSVVSSALSLFAVFSHGKHLVLVYHFVILDLLLLGILSAATGASGAVAYLGYKGNSHTNWLKLCNRYDKFCRYVGTSIFISLFASVLLLLLVLRTIRSLARKITK
ncbi:hypothetical protein M569_08505, partial [Genlisea aurea]